MKKGKWGKVVVAIKEITGATDYEVSLALLINAVKADLICCGCSNEDAYRGDRRCASLYLSKRAEIS